MASLSKQIADAKSKGVPYGVVSSRVEERAELRRLLGAKFRRMPSQLPLTSLPSYAERFVSGFPETERSMVLQSISETKARLSGDET